MELSIGKQWGKKSMNCRVYLLKKFNKTYELLACLIKKKNERRHKSQLSRVKYRLLLQILQLLKSNKGISMNNFQLINLTTR
jgi:hypothetical protein